MSIIRMTHPDHGTHICYSTAEVDVCKKNGWSIEEKKQPEQQNAAPKKARKKRGPNKPKVTKVEVSEDDSTELD